MENGGVSSRLYVYYKRIAPIRQEGSRPRPPAGLDNPRPIPYNVSRLVLHIQSKRGFCTAFVRRGDTPIRSLNKKWEETNNETL